MTQTNKAFSVQSRVRGPWRRYLDRLTPLRPNLHRYCCKLTGNVWDGEDLVQDTLIKVFSLLGKIDTKLENPQAYLVRTATNLWIDRLRRNAREQALVELERINQPAEDDQNVAALALRDASRQLLQQLHPQERAAIVLKEVYDYSLEECAALLKTSVGAVKSALHRGRGRMQDNLPKANFATPKRALVEQFMRALSEKDLATLKQICASDLSLELVGGAELNSFNESRSFFSHAHMSIPMLGFGTNPHWQLMEYEGEWMVIGYRTLAGVEGINEVHRLEVLDDRIIRVRAYCFCPDTLTTIGQHLDKPVLQRPIPYRSPALTDIPGLILRGLFRAKTASP